MISVYQLFFWPGAMRWSLIVQGKGSEPSAGAASASRVALSHVLQGARPPLPSGRSLTISLKMARTFLGVQPARKGRWQACIPRSPITPYSPLNSTMRFQLIGFRGSRSLECRNPVSASMI